MIEIIVVLLYLLIMIIGFVFEINYIFNIKISNNIKKSLFKGISNIIQQNKENYKDENKSEFKDSAKELQVYYEYFYSRNFKYMKDLNDIIAVLNYIFMLLNINDIKNLKRKNLYELREEKEIIYRLIKYFTRLYPYKEFTDNQQKILKEIQLSSECDFNNVKLFILDELKEEFYKLNVDIKINKKNNKITLIFTIIGLIVSIAFGIVSFF